MMFDAENELSICVLLCGILLDLELKFGIGRKVSGAVLVFANDLMITLMLCLTFYAKSCLQLYCLVIRHAPANAINEVCAGLVDELGR